MKRLHVHLTVDDLARSIDFYSALFGSAPSLTKHDYAKWAMEDPRVNFAISKRDHATGLDHLGIQVEDDAALTEIAQRLASAGAELVEQRNTRCCYARSDKAWSKDPQGISWETFLSHGEADALTACGDDGDCNAAEAVQEEICCATAACGSAPAGAGHQAACCA